MNDFVGSDGKIDLLFEHIHARDVHAQIVAQRKSLALRLRPMKRCPRRLKT